jgi:hypothetical protein
MASATKAIWSLVDVIPRPPPVRVVGCLASTQWTVSVVGTGRVPVMGFLVRRPSGAKHGELHPPIERATLGGGVVGNRDHGTETARHDAPLLHTGGDEGAANGVRPLLAQPPLERVIAASVRVNAHLDARPLRVLADLSGDGLHLRPGRFQQRGAPALETNGRLRAQDGPAVGLGRGDRCPATASARGVLGALIDAAQFDAAVQEPALRSPVVGDGHVEAVSVGHEAVGGHAPRNQRGDERLGAGLREPDLPASCPDAVDMHPHLEEPEFGVCLEVAGERVEVRLARRHDRGLGELEDDGLRRVQRIAEQERPAGVRCGGAGAPGNASPTRHRGTAGATRLGFGRLVRAFVLEVGNAVPVVVRVRDAVVVLEAVPVLGTHRVAVVGVRQHVEIVVRLGAAVAILETVEVLGDVRTQVDFVADEILVEVVGRFPRPDGFGFGDDLPGGTAILGNESRLLRTRIHPVGDLVAVVVVSARGGLEPHERAPGRCAVAGQEAGPAPEGQVQAVVDANPEADVRVGGRPGKAVEGGARRRGEAGFRHGLNVCPEPLRDAEAGRQLVVEHEVFQIRVLASAVPQIQGQVAPAAARQFEHEPPAHRRGGLPGQCLCVAQRKARLTDEGDADDVEGFVDELELEGERRITEGARCQTRSGRTASALRDDQRDVDAEVEAGEEPIGQGEIRRPSLRDDVDRSFAVSLEDERAPFVTAEHVNARGPVAHGMRAVEGQVRRQHGGRAEASTIRSVGGPRAGGPAGHHRDDPQRPGRPEAGEPRKRGRAGHERRLRATARSRAPKASANPGEGPDVPTSAEQLNAPPRGWP